MKVGRNLIKNDRVRVTTDGQAENNRAPPMNIGRALITQHTKSQFNILDNDCLEPPNPHYIMVGITYIQYHQHYITH